MSHCASIGHQGETWPACVHHSCEDRAYVVQSSCAINLGVIVTTLLMRNVVMNDNKLVKMKRRKTT
jgi:hypothetical protein